MKKSAFFDFFNRSTSKDFEQLISKGRENQDYINWNEFALPMRYTNSEREYLAIRESCGLFDVSPIRKIRITGTAAGKLLDYVLTRPVSASKSMVGIYVALCNVDGSLKDDSILYKFDDEDYLLMPSDIDHCAHLRACGKLLALEADEIVITDCTDHWHGLAIQGPLSALTVNTLFNEDFTHLKPFEMVNHVTSGSVIKIARLGFTADLGYEVWFDPKFTPTMQDLVDSARDTLNLEIPGYGLTALEACRLEGAFIVAGWDFSTEADPDPDFARSPYEVGLGWLVDLKKEDFVGRIALLEDQESTRQFVLRQFESDEHVEIEDGCPIFGFEEGDSRQIGTINCSAWSWALRKTIGNISLIKKYSECKSAWIMTDGKNHSVLIRQGPFLNLERRYLVPAPLSN